MYTEFGFEKNGIEIAAEDEDKEDSDDEDTYYHIIIKSVLISCKLKKK